MNRRDFLKGLGMSFLAAANPITLSEASANGIRFYHNEDIPLSDLVQSTKDKDNGNQEKKIVIHKNQHLMEVYLGNHLLKEYEVSISQKPIGDKIKEGDKKTPTGTFYVARKNPNSSFHKALVLGYPTMKHAKEGLFYDLIDQETYQRIEESAKRCKEPPRNTGLGNLIEIHGGDKPGSPDWTWGCVAISNKAMDEVYSFAEVGCTADFDSDNYLDSSKYKTAVIIKR